MNASIDIRTMVGSGYLEDPAARASRVYPTAMDGKPSEGTTRRSTRWASGRAFTASTVGRDMRRKSPALSGASVAPAARMPA